MNENLEEVYSFLNIKKEFKNFLYIFAYICNMKDKIGILTSMTCLIHCMIFPVLGTVFPIFVTLDKPVEWVLLISAGILGSLSFLENVLKHKYWTSLLMFLFGFLLLIVSKYTDLEIFNIFGLIILIFSHYLNYKNIKNNDGCHPHGCKH